MLETDSPGWKSPIQSILPMLQACSKISKKMLQKQTETSEMESNEMSDSKIH